MHARNHRGPSAGRKAGALACDAGCARMWLLAVVVAIATASADMTAFGQRQGVSRPLPDASSVEARYWKRAHASAMRDEEEAWSEEPDARTTTTPVRIVQFEFDPQRALAMAVKSGVRSEGEHLELGSEQLSAMQKQLMALVGAFHRFCDGVTPPVRYTAFRGTLAGALFYDALIRESLMHAFARVLLLPETSRG